MKSNKGITITGLVIYVAAFLMMVITIRNYYYFFPE